MGKENEVSDEKQAKLTPVWRTLLAQAKAFDTRHATHADLVELADKANAAIAPHTPCKRGCSACCYQAVTITASEANVIERYTGRTAQQQPAINFNDIKREVQKQITAFENDRKLYWRVACSFLEHGECTIYEARPIACRLHHTIDDTAELCHGQWDDRVSTLDLRAYHAIHAELELFEPSADIRKWFPRRNK